MNKRILTILVLILGVISCIKEPIYVQFGGSDGYQTISFNNKGFDPITINTRSTLGEDAESRILNLYVFIFNEAGTELVYKHLFTSEERKDNIGAMTNEHSWTVYLDEEKVTTGGVIRMKSPDVENGKLYLIANINDELFNVSSESLSTVKSVSDLNAIVAVLNHPTFSRMGSYLMTGKVENFSITNGALSNSYNILLNRLDSKIEFKVGIVPDAVTTRHEMIFDPVTNSNKEVIVNQTIENFEPIAWQVFRLPKSCKLLDLSSDAASSNPDNFFNGDRIGFENTVIEGESETYPGRKISGFSFYMLENHQSSNKHLSVGTYHLRDKRIKDSSGHYSVDSGGEIWENAPEYGTYVKIEGNVTMNYVEGTESSQTLHTLATYYVHLGDFATDINDYDICRNTHYTYTINIKGVDKIQVEVERDNSGWQSTNEEQSGATGEVFVSQEDIHIFDAHYGQRVFRFNINGMIKQSGGDVKNLTWFVNTPFGRKGMPDKVGIEAIDVVSGFDYKWVHFMINSKEAEYEEPHAGPNAGPLSVVNESYPKYCQKNRVWPGIDSPNLMNIVQFCDFLRKQIQAYQEDPEKNGPNPEKYHIFDSDGNIYVTVFVDEFYYIVDPTSNESRSALWQEFVNKPMRTMHIMCNSSMSADGESSIIKSAVSIRQLAIETIYNTEIATEGWGVESDTEFTGSKYFFTTSDNRDNFKGFDSTTEQHYDMTDMNNGLYNSGQMWNLVKDGVYQTKYWNENINYVQTNPQNFLKEQILRYACLSRNRDENGDGIIDKDEVKWYTAAIGQLQELFVGEIGLSYKARLYNIEEATKEINSEGYYPWRNHVVSSTTNNSRQPLYIWSEEGASFSPYCKEWAKPAVLSVRCVRNLENNTRFDITNKSSYPNSVVQTTANSDGTFTFDLSRLNKLSQRQKVTGELLPLDEKSTMSLVSECFQTGPIAQKEDNSGDRTFNNNDYFSIIQPQLLKGKNICPSGYRVPNIREMTIAYIYIDKSDPFWTPGRFMVANYYSFGHTDVGGNGYDALDDKKRKQYTFFVYKDDKQENITLDPGLEGEKKIRCVRDL